jgi:Ion channel
MIDIRIGWRLVMSINAPGRQQNSAVVVAKRSARFLWFTILSIVAYGGIWILFGFAPVSTGVFSQLLYALSICAIVFFLFLFVGTLHKPGLWDFGVWGALKYKWENFATSLSFVTISIANIVGAFSVIYLQAAHTHAGCFSNIGIDGTNHGLSRLDAVYFTLTTLTTVGYGDVHAASGFCRGWVSAQLCVTLIVIGLGIATLATRIFPARPTEAGSTSGPGTPPDKPDVQENCQASPADAPGPVAAAPGPAPAHQPHPPPQQPPAPPAMPHQSSPQRYPTLQ